MCVLLLYRFDASLVMIICEPFLYRL